jgi:hypothetical protein
MKRGVAVLALVAGALLLFQGVTASAGTGYGTGDCHHGNSNKPCKEDPQPTHGKDCLKHGKHGGENQDHCLPATLNPTPTPTPTPSPSVGGETVVQGKIIKVGGNLAKTGPSATESAGGISLILMGSGLLFRTFGRREKITA